MFDRGSRYHDLETATHTTPDGRSVAYKRRRFLPRAEDLPQLAQVRVEQGERVDQLAARALGDPEQFWQLADANNALDPAELTAEPGRVLRVAISAS